MSLLKVTFLIATLVFLTGCQDVSALRTLSYKHPANPESRTGQYQKMSRTLRPDNQNVRPQVTAAPPPRSVSAGQAGMNKTMDHSAHRGSH